MVSYRINLKKILIMLGMMANSLCLLSFIFLSVPVQYVTVLGIFTVFICALEPNLESFVTQAMVKRGRAGGLLLTSRSLGMAIGAMTGGIVFDKLGIQKNFILGFLFSFIAFIVLLKIKENNIDNVRSHDFFSTTPYRSLLNDRNMVPVYLTVFLFSFGIILFSSLFPVYFTGIGGSKTLLGITNSTIFIIAILVSTPAGMLADKIGRKYILIFGTLCCSLTTGVLYFISDPLITVIIWAFPLHPYISIASIALIADYTTDRNRGVGMGLLIICQSVARVVGPITGSFLADFVTLRGLIPISALILLFAGISSIIFIKEKK